MHGRRIRKYERPECEDLNAFFVEFFKKNNLTKRDYDVLMAIYKCRCLTTELIYDLFFKYSNGKINTSADVTRRRLKYMYDNYLVERFQIDSEFISGSSQTYYLLDTLGAKLVAGQLDLKMSELNWSKEANDNLLPYLNHCIELNSIYSDIFEQSQTKDNIQIQDYLCENHFTCKVYDKQYKVCPDAQLEVVIDNVQKTILIEYDRVKATPSKYIKKHKNYSAFRASNEYTNYFIEYPIVLFITQSWQRAMELKSIFDGVDRTDIRFLFTDVGLISENFDKDIYIESHIGERVKI